MERPGAKVLGRSVAFYAQVEVKKGGPGRAPSSSRGGGGLTAQPRSDESLGSAAAAQGVSLMDFLIAALEDAVAKAYKSRH